MELIKTKNYIQVNGADCNGDFEIRILKDCSQLQIETEDGDVYVNINRKELKVISDAIRKS